MTVGNRQYRLIHLPDGLAADHPDAPDLRPGWYAVVEESNGLGTVVIAPVGEDADGMLYLCGPGVEIFWSNT